MSKVLKLAGLVAVFFAVAAVLADTKGLDIVFVNGFEGTSPPTNCPRDADGDGLLDPACVVTFVPPDPVSIAPPINPTITTGFPDAVDFLYKHPNPVQRGVPPDAIVEHRLAVLKGFVKNAQGQPLPGVLVRVLSHPQFGYTFTRNDGAYDLVVNGGGELVLDYQKDGYLRAQRSELTPWQQWQYYDDVRLIELDTAVTQVPLGPATLGSLARGSAVTDADGTRRATVFFPAATSAEMVLDDGSRQPLPSIGFRATEYTVGEAGPSRMPGPLPDSVGYMYAVELSADEAIAARARRVEFSQPVSLYVENFVGFPVGEGVPLGYYEYRQGTWLPSDTGRVIKILSISGGLAILDVDGTGMPASNAALAEMAITDAERERMASIDGDRNMHHGHRTPSDIAADIREHPNFPNARYINLFMCGAANGPNPLAQYIAEKTGMPVLASYGPASADPTGPIGANVQFWFYH